MASWDDKSELRALLDATEAHGNNWVQVAGEMADQGYHRTPDACRKKAGRLADDENTPAAWGVEEHAPIDLHIKYDPSQQVDWRKRLEHAAKSQEIRQADDPFLSMSEVSIRSDRPIAVLITSDWQLGSLGVEYNTWMKHMTRFMDTNGFYMMVNGDVISNTYAHRATTAVWDQVMAPAEQMQTVGSLLNELIERDKLISVVLSEEHDQKDARETGSSTFVEVVRGAGIPLFDNRGIMLLNVGSVTYVIYSVHRSRYRSFLNQLHSGAREFQLGLPANVVITSHNHQPAIGLYPWYPELRMVMEAVGGRVQLGGRVLVVQTGTYETNNRYAHQGFSLANSPELHFGIFYPDRVDVGIARSFEEAERMISGY